MRNKNYVTKHYLNNVQTIPYFVHNVFTEPHFKIKNFHSYLLKISRYFDKSDL